MTVTKADRLAADLLFTAVPGIPMRSMNHAIVSAAFAKHREDAERPLLERIEKLEAALKEYIGGCTNEECIYCIKARQALGETQ